ncbi:hypothetical protein BDZ90DRAFT_213171, partial [Jaminaea rosea]
RVEAKVWLANERTWISWLHVSLLIGSFSLALFNSTIKTFGIIYAGIAILTLAWGLGNYLRRLHLIKTKYAGSFDDLVGPPLICAALFIAVLLNFIVR